MLGLDAAGKTTILRKLSEENVQDVKPTQGFNVKTLVSALKWRKTRRAVSEASGS